MARSGSGICTRAGVMTYIDEFRDLLRRVALERLIGRRTAPLFVSRRLVRDGKAAYREAKRLGWEGIIAKDERSPYVPHIGRATPVPDWKKQPDWNQVLSTKDPARQGA